jgi:hypothetical protein
MAWFSAPCSRLKYYPNRARSSARTRSPLVSRLVRRRDSRHAGCGHGSKRKTSNYSCPSPLARSKAAGTVCSTYILLVLQRSVLEHARSRGGTDRGVSSELARPREEGLRVQRRRARLRRARRLAGLRRHSGRRCGGVVRPAYRRQRVSVDERLSEQVVHGLTPAIRGSSTHFSDE